jgi:hypothetical protein
MAVRNRAHRPDSVRCHRCGHEVHKGRMQTGRWPVYAGSRLKLDHHLGRRRLKGQPSSRTEGKPAVRNDRGDRGNVGIIRSPIRASILLATWSARS